MKAVKAKIKTDDHVFDLVVDITDWLNQASEKEILDVVNCEFGHDYPTDSIAFFLLDKNDDVDEMFTYLEIMSKRTHDNVGFEVDVNQEEMLEWLRENKPEIYSKIEADHDIRKINFKTCYICERFMLPKDFKSKHKIITKEMKHQFIDMLGEVPTVEEGMSGSRGTMCKVCLRAWQESR